MFENIRDFMHGTPICRDRYRKVSVTISRYSRKVKIKKKKSRPKQKEKKKKKKKTAFLDMMGHVNFFFFFFFFTNFDTPIRGHMRSNGYVYVCFPILISHVYVICMK